MAQLTPHQRHADKILGRLRRLVTRQHTGTVPVRALISGQTSPNKPTQSDTTRSADLELKIQSRVTSELERLAAEEAEKLKQITSQEEPPTPADEAPSLLDKVTGEAAEKQKRAELSNGSVSKEISSLKEKLEKRKKVEAADPGVEKAKEELVQCLRINDRRPLDCWKEKEAFKREVGRLERAFVEKTVR
jgi:altered-inheritance-of-mitochondria protein 13